MADVFTSASGGRCPVRRDPTGLNILSAQDDYRRYRSWVGRPQEYDLLALNQIALLTCLGLREHHRVLDLGCGPLRLGRLLIPFLHAGCYHGVEPDLALVEAGVRDELGWDAFRIKRPLILPLNDFSLWRFGRSFDFVVAHSVFTHTQPALALKGLSAVRGVMTPDGVFAATFIATDPPRRPVSGAWIYPECITYTTDETRDLYRRSGLRVLEASFPHAWQDWWLATVDDLIPSPGDPASQPRTWAAGR